MAMLEHDATLHTRHGIERLMYRGRYSAEAVSYTAPQPHPRALPKVLAHTLREKSSVICLGPCVTVAELACRSGAVRRAQMSF